MATRKTIPTETRNAINREFNHRCAMCGADKPQIHHIDGDPSNNALENLIPLCPNCHLVDQHDATNSMPPEKLAFFRKYKHRYILKPQFNPVFTRMKFLSTGDDSDTMDTIARSRCDLVALIRELAMGDFYSAAIDRLLKSGSINVPLAENDPRSEANLRVYEKATVQQRRQLLREVQPEVERLIVEMLDFQPWGDSSL